jgi:hypothetical protein
VLGYNCQQRAPLINQVTSQPVSPLRGPVANRLDSQQRSHLDSQLDNRRLNRRGSPLDSLLRSLLVSRVQDPLSSLRHVRLGCPPDSLLRIRHSSRPGNHQASPQFSQWLIQHLCQQDNPAPVHLGSQRVIQQGSHRHSHRLIHHHSPLHILPVDRLRSQPLNRLVSLLYGLRLSLVVSPRHDLQDAPRRSRPLPRPIHRRNPQASPLVNRYYGQPAGPLGNQRHALQDSRRRSRPGNRQGSHLDSPHDSLLGNRRANLPVNQRVSPPDNQPLNRLVIRPISLVRSRLENLLSNPLDSPHPFLLDIQPHYQQSSQSVCRLHFHQVSRPTSRRINLLLSRPLYRLSRVLRPQVSHLVSPAAVQLISLYKYLLPIRQASLPSNPHRSPQRNRFCVQRFIRLDSRPRIRRSRAPNRLLNHPLSLRGSPLLLPAAIQHRSPPVNLLVSPRNNRRKHLVDSRAENLHRSHPGSQARGRLRNQVQSPVDSPPHNQP